MNLRSNQSDINGRKIVSKILLRYQKKKEKVYTTSKKNNYITDNLNKNNSTNSYTKNKARLHDLFEDIDNV